MLTLSDPAPMGRQPRINRRARLLHLFARRTSTAVAAVASAALDKYGKPYEWVLYDHEGHGFNRDENVFDFYHRVEKFLARYLGPAAAQASVH
jgi:hypothetical protein